MDNGGGDTDRTGQALGVFLLDDHEVVRVGVAALIDAQPDLEVVGQAASATEAIREIPATQPDVAVLDVRLEDGDGIDVCRHLKANHPDIACLILTSVSSDQLIVDASRAGAAGLAVKQLNGTDIVHAIRNVGRGQTLLDDATARLALRRLKESDIGPLQRLTPQERRIFDLIGRGCTNRQIADQMYLAEKTVKNYVSNVLAKLGMSRRTEAAALAARLDERQRAS